MTDTEIKIKGLEVLTRYMGLVEAEKEPQKDKGLTPDGCIK